MAIDKQTAKLGARILENLPDDLNDDTMQGWIDNPKGLQKFLRGLCPPPVVVPPPAPPSDFMIHVDRSVRPVYPDWVKPKSINSPEFLVLEGTGPSGYNLQTQVEEWLHYQQEVGRTVKGQVIYDYLKSTNNALADQLGLADLLAIQAKGKVFRQLYKGKAVFGWKSVIEARLGSLRVPYLYESNDEVVLSWSWLDHGWDSRDPALRFRK